MEFIKRNLIWRNEMKSYRKIIPGIRLDCFMTVSSNAKQKAWIPQRKIKKLLLFTPKSHYFPISFHQSPCSFNPAQTLFNISLFVTFWWKLKFYFRFNVRANQKALMRQGKFMMSSGWHRKGTSSDRKDDSQIENQWTFLSPLRGRRLCNDEILEKPYAGGWPDDECRKVGQTSRREREFFN